MNETDDSTKKIGYRMWFGTPDGLVSLGHNTVWRPGEIMTAQDELSEVSKDNISDGIYSYKTLMRAISLGEKMQAQDTLHRPAIIGSIYFDGEVLEHETGYRCTKATIRSIDLQIGGHYHQQGRLQNLQEKYGVGYASELASKENDGEKASRVVFVLGAYRGGTSLVAAALSEKLGVDFGTDRILPPDSWHHATPYLENVDFLAANISLALDMGGHWFEHTSPPGYVGMAEHLGYDARAKDMLTKLAVGKKVLGLKDFRASSLLPFWRRTVDSCGLKTSVAIALRHPANAVGSAQSFDWSGVKRQMTRHWVRNIASAIIASEGCEAAIVDYDKIVGGTAAYDQIGKALGLPSEVKEGQAPEDPDHRHFSYTSWKDFSATEEPKLALEMYYYLKDKIKVDDDMVAKAHEWMKRYGLGEV